MAIVNERHNPSKPVQVDPKTGKPLPTSTPARTASPTVPEPDGSANGGFFGSFFAAKNKKKAAAMEAPPPTLKASGTLSERENIEVEVISKAYPSTRANMGAELTVAELLISSYYNIVKRTMIDMVPKAIMLTLVQYVSAAQCWWRTADTSTGLPRMKCSENCWRTCTRRIPWTNCSRRATLLFAGGRSASRWSSRSPKPVRLSAKCSERQDPVDSVLDRTRLYSAQQAITTS